MMLTSEFGKPKLTEHSTNIHKECYKIKDDLVILGLGGSFPSYYEDYETRKSESIYFPFPYKNEEEISQDLLKLFSSADDAK